MCCLQDVSDTSFSHCSHVLTHFQAGNIAAKQQIVFLSAKPMSNKKVIHRNRFYASGVSNLIMTHGYIVST